MSRQKITYLWGNNSLLINMGNRANGRVRALSVFEFLCTATLATIFFIQSFPLKNNYFHWITGSCAVVLYVLASRRLLQKFYLTEKILLEENCISFITKNIFSEKVKTYDYRLLRELHYEGPAAKTDHPLKGRTFDYWGFDTQEKLLQSMQQNCHLYFETREGRLYFAQGVYSWDAEEMVQMMRIFMGSHLLLGPEWEQMLQTHEMDDANN